MDTIFFSWLAAQPYSIEVAVGALFVVIIAPAVLAGMAAAATWLERLIGELLRLSGLLLPLEREQKTLWRLRPSRRAAPRSDAADRPRSHPRRPGTHTAG